MPTDLYCEHDRRFLSRLKNSSSTMDRDEPQQKLKPTAKAKQMVGPSYLTGSKAKCTSHSDNDSSGSQSHQPPFKKQMKLGTKQADKSVEINSDDTTSDSNAIDTNTVGEYVPAEALQNVLVLESMFRYVNLGDLLSCRVVNKKWQYEATKELRRRKLIIRFSFGRHQNQMRRNIAIKEICRRLSECRTPSLLSSFQVKAVALNDLGTAGVTSFFQTVGNKLKHLTLHLNSSRKSSFFERRSFMVDFQKIIFRQAPNLEFLEIEFDFPDRWSKDELHAFDSSNHRQNGDSEFQLLPNLKTFIISGTPAPMFFADVINAAVNLRSLGGGYWTACFEYLTGAEGITKIHLLKSLSFQLPLYFRVGWNEPALEDVETFVTENNQYLKLENFECRAEFLHGNSSLASRYVNVVNQILVCSSGSLQKLRIEPAKWFSNMLIIPRLPELKEICFDCVSSSRSGLDGDGFFPQGFNMNTTFPNVSSIVLLRCTANLFRQFVNRMRMEMTVPVPSIRYIILNDKGKKGNIDPPLATVTDFRHVFPNLVSISYVDSDKYYKI